MIKLINKYPESDILTSTYDGEEYEYIPCPETNLKKIEISVNGTLELLYFPLSYADCKKIDCLDCIYGKPESIVYDDCHKKPSYMEG